MARKSKAVAKHKIPDIAASLKAKAATPITVTLEDTISQLTAPIQAMLDAGYSYEDVAEVFKSHGVELAASSIQTYHRKHNKSSESVAGKPSGVAEETSTSTSTAVDKNEEESLRNERSSEDDDSSLASGTSNRDLEDEKSESVVDESPLPQPKTKGNKESLPPATQPNSKFNVTDRSKL